MRRQAVKDVSILISRFGQMSVRLSPAVRSKELITAASAENFHATFSISLPMMKIRAMTVSALSNVKNGVPKTT